LKQSTPAASSSSSSSKKKRLENTTISESGSPQEKTASRNVKKQLALAPTGAYVRVSSRSQGHAMQRAAIERCAEARGHEIGAWFTETMSAKKLGRPVLDRVRELARTGDLKRLYVYRLDRLSRSGIRDTLGLVDELRHAGCDLVTVADGFSLDGPASDVVTAMLAWAAQMERLAIGERISAARGRVERNGGHWGRPSTVTPEKRVHILAARDRGETIRAISIKWKVPRSTVANVLSQKGAYASPAKTSRKKAPKKARPPSSG
jgi:DNA invertase Pin-like site-specific DNA recombinase